MSIHLNAGSKAKALDFCHKLSLWRMIGSSMMGKLGFLPVSPGVVIVIKSKIKDFLCMERTVCFSEKK